MSGMFDKEEWSFECKRDERAAKELEDIKKIREEWMGWGDKRLIKYEGENAAAKAHNEDIANFVTAQINTEIAKLQGRYNG